jgi:hypothetical protein
MPNILCAVCGASSEQTVAAGAEVVPREPPDFDTRPGEPLRSTLQHWLQQCPQCGYAAPELAYAPEGVAALVKSEQYLNCEGPFLRHAFLLDQLGHHADAGWMALQGAWFFDDEGDDGLALGCRAVTLQFWKKGKAAGQNFAETIPEEFALVTDILRRSGMFEEALGTCLDALDDEELPPVIEDMLRMQKAFIEKKDYGRHSLAELPERPAGSTRVTL